ncbi:MAG: hypothetical protein KIS62_01605 [Ramlibacter sp.]|nr:hypothetical protein [Ramlibacter sp.]
MSAFLPDSFARLGLTADADERAVKRAYASILKQIDLHAQPEQFAQLRQDYETALAFLRNGGGIFHPPEVVQAAPAPETVPETKATPPVPPQNAPEPAPALDPVPQESIDALVTRLGSSTDTESAKSAIQAELATGRFDSIAMREVLEAQLVEAIGTRRFGSASVSVLRAAADVFAWETRPGGNLDRMRPQGSNLARALDEVLTISPEKLSRWQKLTGEPDRKMALELLKPGEIPGDEYPFLTSMMFEPGHIQRWEEARVNSHLAAGPVHLAKFAARRIHWGLVAAQLGLVVFGVVVLKFLFSVAQGNEQLKASAACDAAYAHAIEQNWQGVDMKDAVVLRRCSMGTLPLRCADREQLDSVLSTARSLNGVGYGYYFGPPLAVHLADGRLFGLGPAFDCDAAWHFASHGSWLRQGDLRAAYQFVADLASCLPHRDEKIVLLRTLLQHTDAWPEQNGRGAGPAAHLSTMVSKQDPPAWQVGELKRTTPPGPCLENPGTAELAGLHSLEANAISQKEFPGLRSIPK